jgi:hypothetical protein
MSFFAIFEFFWRDLTISRALQRLRFQYFVREVHKFGSHYHWNRCLLNGDSRRTSSGFTSAL